MHQQREGRGAVLASQDIGFLDPIGSRRIIRRRRRASRRKRHDRVGRSLHACAQVCGVACRIVGRDSAAPRKQTRSIDEATNERDRWRERAKKRKNDFVCVSVSLCLCLLLRYVHHLLLACLAWLGSRRKRHPSNPPNSTNDENATLLSCDQQPTWCLVPVIPRFFSEQPTNQPTTQPQNISLSLCAPARKIHLSLLSLTRCASTDHGSSLACVCDCVDFFSGSAEAARLCFGRGMLRWLFVVVRGAARSRALVNMMISQYHLGEPITREENLASLISLARSCSRALCVSCCGVRLTQRFRFALACLLSG